MIKFQEGAYWVLYTFTRGQLDMPRYLTPDGEFSYHRYQAQVFRDADSFHKAQAWMAARKIPISATEADERPYNPKHCPKERSNKWRIWP